MELPVGGRGEDGDTVGPVPVELAVPPGADACQVVLQGEPALPLAAVRLRLLLELGEERVELGLGLRSGRRRRWIQVDVEADRAAILGPKGRERPQDVVCDGGGHGAVLSGRPRSIPEEHPAAPSRLLLQTDFRRGALLERPDVRELIIIGGGPAGYTAALYAARADLEPLVIEGFAWGGQLMITSDVENYPGYADGIMGPEMMSDFRRQAERFGAEYVTDDVTRVDFSEQPFRVWVGDDEYRSQAVIVATGASARWLGIESEAQHKGRGVSACATCDASFFREKNVYVVGGGDSAFEEALFLTKFATSVHLVHRRDEFRASRIMVDRAEANDKLDFVLNAEVEEILGDVKVEGLRLRNTVSARRGRSRRTGCSSRSGTTRTPGSSTTSSTTTMAATW